MQITLNRLEIARLPAVLRRAGQWWLKELFKLFPEPMAELLAGRRRQLLVITADQQGAALELLSGAHVPIARGQASPTADTLAEVDRFLRSQGLGRKDVDIGLRLPAELVFCRQLLLPAEAADAIDAVVAQDLAKKTPFKPEDIYSDHLVLDRADGKVAVWQWIARRQYVDQALWALKLDIEQAAFVVFAPLAAEQPRPFINLRPEQRSRNLWGRKAALILCGSALVLALLTGGMKYWNQEAALDRLDAEIATTTRKAQQVRALADQLQERKNALLRLRLKRNETPGLIDLWEEVSQVLPTHSWLTEFRLAETAGKREEITIHGFSSAAASLVGIIDSSPLLFDAALTSPIAHDASEGRERFALQAKVKAPVAFKEAVR